MGSSDGEKGRYHREGPYHTVTVPSFYLGKCPVTNQQYGEFLKANPNIPEPAYWADKRLNQPRQPVVGVSWNEARAFCDQAGLVLPSEAQWEYACRAGTTTPFSTGKTITIDQANYSGRHPHGGAPKGEYRGRTARVQSFPPNAFGLHEMHGNVWEWCEDTWHDSFEGAPADGSSWVDEGAGYRVVRGGGWYAFARWCRSAFRGRNPPGFRDNDLGFRPAKPSP